MKGIDMKLSTKNVKLNPYVNGLIRVSFETIKGASQWYFEQDEFHEANQAFNDLKANGVIYRNIDKENIMVFVPVYNNTIQHSQPF